MLTIAQILAKEFNQPQAYVENIIRMIDDGDTIPFIARYRKELHGAMDDQTIRSLAERLGYLRNLQTRRREVKRAIAAQGKLTDELSRAIDAAATLTEVEDLYRPCRPRRRTRATIARDRGLEPLARTILDQPPQQAPLRELAAAYVSPEAGVGTAQDALDGASDIIAEWISDDAGVRRELRGLMQRQAIVRSKQARGAADSVYRHYYDYEKPARKLQSHQILAIDRGEREGFLRVTAQMDREQALQAVRRRVIRPGSPAAAFLEASTADCFDRLLAPSLERELRADLTDRACEAAIRSFAANLKPLLLQRPLHNQVTMGLDPGFRNGCKVAVVDGTGRVLSTTVINPMFSEPKRRESIAALRKLIGKYQVTSIAIGNGTASRETERMVVDMLKDVDGVGYAIVSEAGASVYSASKVGAEEFPNYDVTIRSAISIARRLQDPLAELVKIDPKALGVGQYQHDMPQARLDEVLGAVVEDCVNAVGVNLNTASEPLLRHVSGLNAATARSIVAYRESNGPFKSREQLHKVPRLGPKAFEQCAGFLRVPDSASPLDRTAVHPESYDAAERLLSLCGFQLSDVGTPALLALSRRVDELGRGHLAGMCGVGAPTLRDIVRELTSPGRDPRDELPPPILRTDVLKLDDLKPGMLLRGTVRNVTDFGAFVDIGVHQDGLVHVSRLSDRFVRHPAEVVRVGDVVDVTVLEVDAERRRIGLDMRSSALRS